MNKTDLISAMSKRAGLTRDEAERALDAFLETLTNALREGDKVQLVGYGTFERTGRNPQTGEEIVIPATRVPTFKPGKILKDIVS